MMVVDHVGTDMHEGREMFVWTGAVYKLEGQGAGPNALFLGDMTARRGGRGVWKFPVDLRVQKGVPTDEADYQIH